MWFAKRKSPFQNGPSGQSFFGFTRELFVALCMALVVILYVIQAFKIPTESMADSLLANDFLLGLKFIYGAPVLPYTHAKFPGIVEPKPGDVVIFKYPGPDSKDYIKRCVGGPGDTVEVRQKNFYRNGREIPLPPFGKHISSQIAADFDPRDSFPPIRVPAKGDTFRFSRMDIRDFYFARIVVHQENPSAELRTDLQLYVDGNYRNQDYVFQHYYRQVRFGDFNFEMMEWYQVEQVLQQVKQENPGKPVEIKKFLSMDGKPLDEYVLNNNCYFMMGDNRDNSKDSRYWGFLNKKFVKAKALILYFSYEGTFLDALSNPVQNIRWSRIGKLIQ